LVTVTMNPYHFLTQRLKIALPKSLFGRALLILMLPTIIVQILAVTVFYERHWASIQRHLASSLAGEVAVMMDRAIQSMPEDRVASLANDAQMMNMRIRLLPLDAAHTDTSAHDRFNRYVKELRKRLDVPFIVYPSDNDEVIRTEVTLIDQVVQINVDIKRLESSTTSIFVFWVLGSAALLTLIATLFLRNQIRPISRLAEAAERFGRGQDVGNFRPHGAEEVRTAGRAFMVMRSRITRQVTTRSAMLTGVSHDLRTPLTRLKLQLAMQRQTEDVRAMQQDVQEMEHMLQEYLEFARGNDESIPTEMVDMADFLRGIIHAYHAAGASITYTIPETVVLPIRPMQLRRAVQNIITNALTYGHRCHISLELSGGWLGITIEDEGGGIPEEAMEEVFRPFTRLEASRNLETGGVGLGLAITRDIVQAHGGKVQMRNRYGDIGDVLGLSVLLLLPIPRA
jgi:two-component system, OmpR family, osmolarity sensor histidine kinase EnvZ